MITTILTSLLVLIALVVLLPVALYYGFKKHMLPEVFVDIDVGYGIRKPHWARQIVCIIGLPISGLVDLVLNFKEKKEYKSPIYNRSEGKFFVTDPSNYTVKAPDGEEREHYFAERVSAVNTLIAQAGWRAVFFRHLIEMPTNNVIEQVVKIGKDSKLSKVAQRETLFVVY